MVKFAKQQALLDLKNSISHGDILHLWNNLAKLKDQSRRIHLEFLLNIVNGVDSRIEDSTKIARSLLQTFCHPLSIQDQAILKPVSQALSKSFPLVAVNSFPLITLEELTDNLQTPYSWAAPGLDGFLMLALKKTLNVLRPHLLQLFN